MKKIVTAVILVVSIICIGQIDPITYGMQTASQPFEIEVSDVTITDATDLHLEETSSSAEETCRRLSFEVSIYNHSDQEYKDVWFELSLNQEVQPYIATGILNYTSEKMDVTTAGDAKKNEVKNGKPNVCGFTHTWDMLLTTEEDLAEYSDLVPQGIEESLKTVTVCVFWDGGEQKETKTLHISEKAEDAEDTEDTENAGNGLQTQ